MPEALAAVIQASALWQSSPSHLRTEPRHSCIGLFESLHRSAPLCSSAPPPPLSRMRPVTAALVIGRRREK
jgi:hypothetical protein